MKTLGRLATLAIIIGIAASLMLPQLLSASTVSDETLKIIKNAGDKTKYPDANAIIILEKTDGTYKVDGSAMMNMYGLIKILTQAGIDEYGEKHFEYYKTYDNVRVATARVIKQDGSVVDVPDDMIKEINSTGSEEMNIYEPDGKDKVVTFKNLEIGDCIEYMAVDSIFHSPMDGEIDGSEVFQVTDPIIRKEFNVTGPKSKPLNYICVNGQVPYSRVEHGDLATYTWKIENAQRIISEPAMPALSDVAPTVHFSTIKSWEDISRWWNQIAESKYAMNDEMSKEVDGLIAGKTSKQEKIDAIYRYVADKVRYMGLGTGKKKGFEPKPVVETYQTKYGVCRDVAAMMVAMLRKANVESEIVLTGVGYKIPKELPSIEFNHAIVAIKNDKGGYDFADPTVDNSRNLFPSVEAEQQVLLCTKKGNTLIDTPHQAPEQNMGSIKANSNLTENGTFTSDVTITTDGIYDLALRGWAKAMPAAQMNVIWNYMIQNVYPGARLTGLSIGDADDYTKSFQIKLSYQVDNYPMEAGKFTLMKSPVSMGVFEIMSKFLFQSASLPDRQYPWNLGFTFGATEEETINLPPGLKIKSVPDPISKTYGPVEYKMTYTNTKPTELASGGTQVSYQKKLLVNSKEMSPEQYKQFKDVMLAASKASRGEIIMEKDKNQ